MESAKASSMNLKNSRQKYFVAFESYLFPVCHRSYCNSYCKTEESDLPMPYKKTIQEDHAVLFLRWQGYQLYHCIARHSRNRNNENCNGLSSISISILPLADVSVELSFRLPRNSKLYLPPFTRIQSIRASDRIQSIRPSDRQCRTRVDAGRASMYSSDAGRASAGYYQSLARAPIRLVREILHQTIGHV